MPLAIAQANKLIPDRLTECGADPDTAFTFKWLYDHAEVLWLCGRLNVDFDLHMNKMFKLVTVLLMLVINPDHMIEWQMKNAQHWILADDQTCATRHCFLDECGTGRGLNLLVSLI